MLWCFGIFVLITNAIAGKQQSGVRGDKEFAARGESFRRLQPVDLTAGVLSNVVTYETPIYALSPAFVPTSVPKFAPSERPLLESPAYISPSYTSMNKREKFEKLCLDTLLSANVSSDQLISQNDYAAFLTSYCIMESICGKTEQLQFEMLPTPLQLAFIDPLCEKQPVCLVEEQPEFGFVVNPASTDIVSIQITAMCNLLFPLLGDYVGPTPAPSSNDYYHPLPTAETSAPSKIPVAAPPKHNTKAPVESPVYPEHPVYTEPPVYTKSPVAAPVYTESPEHEGPVAPVYTESPVVKPIATPTERPIYTFSPVNTNTTISPAPSVSPTVPRSSSPTLLATTANPVSLSPSPSPSFAPTILSTTAAPVIIGPTQTTFPSMISSIMPSSAPATVFINEIGTFNDTEFVEVVYSTFLGSGITNYALYFYGAMGMVLYSENLREGFHSVNGMTFTFITYPSNTSGVEAIALVYDASKEVLYFFSKGEVLQAVDGPAKGMNATDILNDMSATRDETRIERIVSRRTQGDGTNETLDSSVSLVGTGCQFGEFTFAEAAPTPGYVNAGQEITGCQAGPSAAPSIEIGGTGGITTGAIVGISVSSALLLIVLLFTMRGSDPFIEEDEESVTFEFGQKSFQIPPGEDLMADTGDIEGDILVSASETTAKPSAGWWNSVYWVGGVSGADKSQEVKSTEVQSQCLDVPPSETSGPSLVGPVSVGLAVGAVVANVSGPKAKQNKQKQNWFFARTSNQKPIPGDNAELLTEDIEATATAMIPTQKAEATDTQGQELNVLPAESEDTDVASIPGRLVAGASVAEVSYSKKKKQYWLFGRTSGGKSTPVEDPELLTENVAVTSDETFPKQGKSESTGITEVPSSPVAGSEPTEVGRAATGGIAGAIGAQIVTPTTKQTKEKKQIRIFGRSSEKVFNPAAEAKHSMDDTVPSTDVSMSMQKAVSSDLGLIPAVGSAPSNVQQVAVGMAIGAVEGTVINKTKKKRGWIFRRGAEKSSSLPGSDKVEPFAQTEFIREETGGAKNLNDPSVVPSPLKAGDAASIALSRRDDDSDEDLISMTSGEVSTETLENLDAALERHDWNAIYNITKRTRKANDSGPRTAAYGSGSREISKSVAAAVHSDSESDISESDADQLGMDTSHGTGMSKLSDLHGSDTGIDTPNKVGTLSSPKSESTVSDPTVAGWVGFFRRKKASKGNSHFTYSSPFNPASDLSDLDTAGAHGAYSASSMDEDSLGENLVDIALAKSSPSKLAATIERTEPRTRPNVEPQVADGEKKQRSRYEPVQDTPLKEKVPGDSDGAVDKQPSLVESIQKISSELEDQTRGGSRIPALAISTTEEEIAKLIDSKDWQALGDFSLREEGLLEQELENIQLRSMTLDSEAERRIQQEFDATMTTIRSKDGRETGQSGKARKDNTDA